MTKKTILQNETKKYNVEIDRTILFGTRAKEIAEKGLYRMYKLDLSISVEENEHFAYLDAQELFRRA